MNQIRSKIFTMKATNSIQIPSPIGWIVCEANEIGLVRLEILRSESDLPNRSTTDGDSAELTRAHLLRAETAILDYFESGTPIPPLALDLVGTDFQRSVWDQISRVAFGQTSSYSEIAELIGNPRAVRAVGGAVGANPVPLLIGCHRVLGSGGRITGYSGGSGLKTKRELLTHEGIDFRE